MTSPATQVLDDVRRYGTTLVTAADRLGRRELADRLRQESARGPDDRLTLVVAGDIKRGKSSLVNALVERRDLLPVDADVATSVQLLVEWADRDGAQVTRRRGDTTTTTGVGLDELVDVASMLGDPELRRDVVDVRVGVPHTLLERGVALLDTPGVGTMSAGHRDLTLAALGLADGLLFTMSTDGPVLRSELDFLALAAARVDNVVLVLTKIDAEGDWTTLQAENAERMREYAHQLRDRADAAGADEMDRERARRFTRLLDAPVLPVSSRLELEAQRRVAAGRDASAAARGGGFAALRACLDRMADHRELTRAVNRVQLGASVAATLAAEQEDRVRAAEQDAELDARVEAEERELNHLASVHAKWRQRFGYQMQTVQAEANRVLTREFLALEATYRDRIEAGTALRDLADDLHASALAVWSTVAATLARNLGAAVRGVGEEVGLPELQVPLDELAPPQALQALDRRTADGSGERFDWIDDGVPLVTVTSAMGGLAFTLMGPPGWVAGAVVACAITFARYKRRGDRMTRQDDVKELREGVGAARQECISEVGLRLPSLRAHLEAEIDRRIAELDEDVRRRRKALAELVRQSRSERQSVRETARKHVTELRKLHASADGLRDRVVAALGT